jgi:hypothetical protein
LDEVQPPFLTGSILSFPSLDLVLVEDEAGAFDCVSDFDFLGNFAGVFSAGCFFERPRLRF